MSEEWTKVNNIKPRGSAQQLFACLVSDQTMPDKTEVCNFFSKADVWQIWNLLVQHVYTSGGRCGRQCGGRLLRLSSP